MAVPNPLKPFFCNRYVHAHDEAQTVFDMNSEIYFAQGEKLTWYDIEMNRVHNITSNFELTYAQHKIP